MRKERTQERMMSGGGENSRLLLKRGMILFMAVIMTMIMIPVSSAWADSSDSISAADIVSGNQSTITTNNSIVKSINANEILDTLKKDYSIIEENGSFSSGNVKVEVSGDTFTVTSDDGSYSLSFTLKSDGSVDTVNGISMDEWTGSFSTVSELGKAVTSLSAANAANYNDAVEKYISSIITFNAGTTVLSEDLNLSFIDLYNQAASAAKKTQLENVHVPAYTILAEPQYIDYSYSVTYDVNAGNDTVTNIPNGWSVSTSVKSYKNLVTQVIPVREGYTFLGWSTSQDGKVEYQHSGTVSTLIRLTRENPSLTLYAVWAKKGNCSVTYKDGADGKVFQDVKYNNLEKGSYTPAFTTVPAREGYTFAGWTPSLSAKVQGNDVYTAKWTKKDSSSSIIVIPGTGDNPNTVSNDKLTVSFHPDNGSDAFTETVVSGDKAVKPESPVRDGYTFSGWYSDTGLTNAYDFNTPVKSNLDLYAKWTKQNVTVNPEQPPVKGFLLPCVLSSGKTSQTLTWTKVNQADGYDIYFAKCDTAYAVYPLKKVASVKADQARIYKKTGLTFKTPYKYVVKAYKIINGKKKIIASSVSVHSIAGNANAKYSNVRAVKTSKKTVSVKKGRTVQLKASVTASRSGKRILYKGHCALVRYISRDKSIATVTASGKVRGKKTGYVKVYILGSNGVRTAVTVKVVK